MNYMTTSELYQLLNIRLSNYLPINELCTRIASCSTITNLSTTVNSHTSMLNHIGNTLLDSVRMLKDSIANMRNDIAVLQQNMIRGEVSQFYYVSDNSITSFHLNGSYPNPKSGTVIKAYINGLRSRPTAWIYNYSTRDFIYNANQNFNQTLATGDKIIIEYFY